jgi:hypothetical protein
LPTLPETSLASSLPDSWLGGSGSARWAWGCLPPAVDAVLLGEVWVLLVEPWVPPAELGAPFAEVFRSVVGSGSLLAARGAWAGAELARGPPDPQPMARIAAPHRHPAPATAPRKVIARC